MDPADRVICSRLLVRGAIAELPVHQNTTRYFGAPVDSALSIVPP